MTNVVCDAPQLKYGLETHRSLSFVQTSQVVKASPGAVYGYYFRNGNAAIRYVKIYDAAASVDAAAVGGTAFPKMEYALAQNQFVNLSFDKGVTFDSGIVVRCTTGIADNDATAPTANDVMGHIHYK